MDKETARRACAAVTKYPVESFKDAIYQHPFEATKYPTFWLHSTLYTVTPADQKPSGKWWTTFATYENLMVWQSVLYR